jgi:predicted DNA-binding transcriptional regulator YafY
MQVHERNAEGWVRVTATTNDLFSAVRLLLTYGDNCRVVGGYEARQEIEKLVDGLARVYGG